MKKIIALASVAALLTASCGTIFHGSRVNVSLRSTPECTVTVDGMEYQTPTIIKLKRGSSHQVTFDKPGYKSKTVLIDNELLVGTLIADIFLAGIIGVVVDFATGAIYTLEPKQISAKLKEAGVSLNLPETEDDEFFAILVDQAQIDAYCAAEHTCPE